MIMQHVLKLFNYAVEVSKS